MDRVDLIWFLILAESGYNVPRYYQHWVLIVSAKVLGFLAKTTHRP